MTFPIAMLNEMCKESLGENFASIVKQSRYKDEIEIKYDKLRIDVDLIKNLFNDAAEKIVTLMRDVVKRKVDLIVLVGGFSECQLIQNEIKSKFPKSKVIVPEDAGISVVKGAVLFGHRPNYIISRIARYTYGVRTTRIFDPDIHDPSKKKTINGEDRCFDLFARYVKIGEEVKLGDEIPNTHGTVYEFQSSVLFEVLKSTSENPLYADGEDCTLLGKLEIQIPNPSKEERSIRVKMIFGNTELMVTAQDLESGETCETTLDLI